MTMIVTKGREEIRAPRRSLRFANSETSTMTNAVTAYLVMRRAMRDQALRTIR